MFVVIIYFDKPDDFSVFGPFDLYSQGKKFLDVKLATLKSDCTGDVFLMLPPHLPGK